MKIIEYKIATSVLGTPIHICVLQFNNVGFDLYGSPFIDGNQTVCQAMVKYEKESQKEIENRKLVDFDVTWHPNVYGLKARIRHMISEGWDLFKQENVIHDDLMNYKLMMVKYV